MRPGYDDREPGEIVRGLLFSAAVWAVLILLVGWLLGWWWR